MMTTITAAPARSAQDHAAGYSTGQRKAALRVDGGPGVQDVTRGGADRDRRAHGRHAAGEEEDQKHAGRHPDPALQPTGVDQLEGGGGQLRPGLEPATG